jgi:hypothetical protein
VGSGSNIWSGDFKTMNSLTKFETGYYGGLNRWPFNNPAIGGLAWDGFGRGCNTFRGWFAVDHVTYDGTTLTSIDLRFEQHCEAQGKDPHGPLSAARPCALRDPAAALLQVRAM